MCPMCGEELGSKGDFSYCSCGYAETSDMSYDEICEMFSCIEDSYDDCPF